MANKYQSSVRINPKIVHYVSNGTGRDSYIGFSNGGVWKENQITTSGPSIGSFPKIKSYQPPAPAIHGKFQHYFPDGTGRDVFIQSDEGGQSIGKFQKNTNFLKSLRSYSIRSDRSNSSKPDYFSIAQTPMAQSSKFYTQNSERKIKQTQLVERLYQIKQKQEPYSEIRKLTSTSYKNLKKV